MKAILLLLVALAVAAAMAYGVFFLQPRPQPQTNIVSQGPTLHRLEQLRRLVILRVCIADVLTSSGEGYRGAWLVRGDALIGVDLGRAQISRKDQSSRQATVRLPLPAVVQARVDHRRTKTWEVRRTTWIPFSGNEDRLRDQVMLEAQKLVEQAAAAEENLRQAQTVAEAVIRGIYAEVGWQVEIVWEERVAKTEAAR